MSKAIISENAEPRELKTLFIVGPDNDIDSEISKLYDREDCLIIGDGTNPVKITEIYKTLQILNLQIGANTRIDISAHGTRSNKEHKILLDQEYTKTKDFLISLQQLLPNNPLYIHLWSCYGGTANKDIEALNIGSIVVTHIKSSYLSSTDLEKFIRIRSLTRYMNENSLSPYLQYLYDQLENYQGATFSQIESERHIVKFKTIRTPQDYSITTRISNILQINITEEKLTKEIQNYLEIEGKNFCELFKNYISIRDIGKFHEYISNVDNENTRDFISGTIIGLIDSLFNLDIKLKNETTKALNNILDNLKPELINHSIGITPLFIAIHNKNSEIAQTLLEKGADPHFVEADGESLLYIACVKNLVGIANLLLEKGANPNIAPKNNYTPLMAACTNQSLKMVEILLEKGAKINEIDSRSFTPLIIACSKNSEGIAKFLLENGADPNLKVQKDFVPLIIACSKNSEGIVSHLLKKNADPNIVDRNGVMPLLVAYKNRSVRIMELLLEKGANPDVINRKTGTTLLYSAYNEGNVKIFQLLINHKANPNLANIDGTTPLMATCKKGDLETAILLLKHGANINEYNVKNDTPLRLACKNGNLELVKMLVEMELI